MSPALDLVAGLDQHLPDIAGHLVSIRSAMILTSCQAMLERLPGCSLQALSAPQRLRLVDADTALKR